MRHLGGRAPQAGRRMQQEQMHVAPIRERAQDMQVPGGQAREAEDREALRQVDEPGLLTQTRARSLDARRWIDHADPVAQTPPQLGLPEAVRPQPAAGAVLIPAGRPGADHLRAVEGITMEELREMTQGAEA